MWNDLTGRLNQAFKRLLPEKRLKEEQIKETLREVRKALNEADVAVPVIKDFIHAVTQKLVGSTLPANLSPAQYFINVLNQELILILGETSEGLNLNAEPPAIILMSGLQGSGKTSTTAKLARWIKETLHKSVMVVSVDIYRPAAILQLKVLAEQCGVSFFESASNQPLEIAKQAHLQAKKEGIQVLIIDTAGRLHIDEKMMEEVGSLSRALNPIENLLVVDSMMGADAAQTVMNFKAKLPLTGVIVTKADSDTRGGALLSIRYLSGLPIKFVGVGEHTDALDPFHPDRFASRILGMGDVLSLIEDISRKVDKEKAEKLAKKLEKGKGFDLEDLRTQMKEMLKVGLSGLMDKIPGLSSIPDALKSKVNDKEVIRKIALLDSMTVQERHFPNIILQSNSRKRRILEGSGAKPHDLNHLMKEFERMQKMMKKLTNKGGLSQMMQMLQGRLPNTY